MRFTPEFLEELRARLPVSEVVGRRVKLKKAGREWKGLSPFQQEKTPSFTVNDQKQFYHDFSTGKHGNIFDFLMETEGVTFPGSRGTARRDGGPAAAGGNARRGAPRGAAQDAARRDGTRGEILRRARSPRATAPRRAAISPIARFRPRRNCSSASAMRCGDRFALKEHLGGQGIPVEDMVETGF